MAELIFLNAFLVGAGLLLLVFLRALPRMDDSSPPSVLSFERWLASGLPEKLDGLVRAASIRLLRRVKVWVLRIENGINDRLQKMKHED